MKEINLLVDFPILPRRKSESHLIPNPNHQKVKFQEQERIKTNKQKYVRSRSLDNLIQESEQLRLQSHERIKTNRKTFIRSASLGTFIEESEPDKNINNEVKPETWSPSDYQVFWNQIDGLRSSYTEYYSVSRSLTVASQSLIAAVGHLSSGNNEISKGIYLLDSSTTSLESRGNTSKINLDDTLHVKHYNEKRSIYYYKNSRNDGKTTSILSMNA